MYDRIKAVREAYRLTQREFGERLGVSRDVISNLEYERVQPKDVVRCFSVTRKKKAGWMKR